MYIIRMCRLKRINVNEREFVDLRNANGTTFQVNSEDSVRPDLCGEILSCRLLLLNRFVPGGVSKSAGWMAMNRTCPIYN